MSTDRQIVAVVEPLLLRPSDLLRLAAESLEEGNLELSCTYIDAALQERPQHPNLWICPLCKARPVRFLGHLAGQSSNYK